MSRRSARKKADLGEKPSCPLAGIKVVLAPLAGITDSVYRRVCLRWGADLVVSEMISAEGLLRRRSQLRAVRNLDTGEGPIALQIFGSRPEAMAEAARSLSELGPRFIDINFGCPVRKVVRAGAGAALLRDLGSAARICRAVVAASSVPVSVKVRAGWAGASPEGIAEIARVMEREGVSVLTVHARTWEQDFSTPARWELIAAAKEAVSIPVIGNGDVHSSDDCLRMFAETGCDAVMIGRGAIGNPWLFSEIKAKMEGKAYRRPSVREKLEVMTEHIEELAERVGERTALVTARKVMAAYTHTLPGARALRRRLMRVKSVGEVRLRVEEYLRRCAHAGGDLDPPRGVSSKG